MGWCRPTADLVPDISVFSLVLIWRSILLIFSLFVCFTLQFAIFLLHFKISSLSISIPLFLLSKKSSQDMMSCDKRREEKVSGILYLSRVQLEGAPKREEEWSSSFICFRIRWWTSDQWLQHQNHMIWRVKFREKITTRTEWVQRGDSFLENGCYYCLLDRRLPFSPFNFKRKRRRRNSSSQLSSNKCWERKKRISLGNAIIMFEQKK